MLGIARTAITLPTAGAPSPSGAVPRATSALHTHLRSVQSAIRRVSSFSSAPDVAYASSSACVRSRRLAAISKYTSACNSSVPSSSSSPGSSWVRMLRIDGSTLTSPHSHSGSSISLSNSMGYFTTTPGLPSTPLATSVSIIARPFTRTPPRSGSLESICTLPQSISVARASSARGSSTRSVSTAVSLASAASFTSGSSRKRASTSASSSIWSITSRFSSFSTHTCRPRLTRNTMWPFS